MAAPIYDPLGWNAPGNTLQDLYNWYQTGEDEDTTGTTGTSGITSAYYPPEPFDRRQAIRDITPLDPVNLGYAGLGDQTREFLTRAQEQAAKSPGYPGTQEEEESFLDKIPGLAWAKGKLGSMPSGVKKTGIAAAAYGLLPFPLNLAAAATQFLPEGEGYPV